MTTAQLLSNLVPTETEKPNQVLQKTFSLLALSMIPTVLGAWVGMETNVISHFSSGWGFISVLAIMFGLIFAINANKTKSTGVALLMGFTFLTGLVMSGLLSMVLSQHDGAQLVMTTIGATGAVFAGMGVLAMNIKKSLTSWGPLLFAALVSLLVASVTNLFIGSSMILMATSGIGALLFSAFLLFDLKMVIDGGETNAISATLGIYLDLVNIFQSILSLLGAPTAKD